MRTSMWAMATAATLLLSACAPAGVSAVGQKYPLFKTNDNNYALHNRDLFVIVHGGGYGADAGSFRQAVLNTMQRYDGGLNTRFTATPQRNYNADYKVVMLFNGPNAAQGGELCGQPDKYAALQPVSGGVTHLLAAFCRFDAPLTEVTARATQVASVNDPRFASLIQQTMVELFPSVDERPLRDDDDDGSGFP